VTDQPDPDSASIDRLAGDSAEQRRAEHLMLDLLERQLHCHLERPWRRSLPGGGRLEVDGGTDNPENAMLVEAWAHQGRLKPAQRAKVLTDAFKLSFAATLLSRRPRLVLLSATRRLRRPSAHCGRGQRRPYGRPASKWWWSTCPRRSGPGFEMRSGGSTGDRRQRHCCIWPEGAVGG
jgi:hypothetical protein